MKRSILSTILLTLALTAGTPTASAVPETLDVADWDQIRAEHDRHRHAAVAADSGYFARNPMQQWLIEFDGRSFTAQPEHGDWNWGKEGLPSGWPFFL